MPGRAVLLRDCAVSLHCAAYSLNQCSYSDSTDPETRHTGPSQALPAGRPGVPVPGRRGRGGGCSPHGSTRMIPAVPSRQGLDTTRVC